MGTFYEPEFIYIDYTLIESLPKKEYASGIAEVIKHGLCQSKKLLQSLENKEDYKFILKEVIKLKTSIIDADPRELHEGLILVYGHTIGHAVEIASNQKLNHGEAISIGMVAAAKISYELGYCDKSLVEIHEIILKKYDLPTKIPADIKTDEISKILFYDKKERKNKMTFVLLENIEKVKTINGKYGIPVDEKNHKEDYK